MHIYIGNKMYEINPKTVAASKEIAHKMLLSTKEICEASLGGQYLYLSTLVMLKAMSERTLSGLSDEKLEEVFGPPEERL